MREYDGVSTINIAKWTLRMKCFRPCLAGCGGACDDQYFHGVSPPLIFEQNLYIFGSFDNRCCLEIMGNELDRTFHHCSL